MVSLVHGTEKRCWHFHIWQIILCTITHVRNTFLLLRLWKLLLHSSTASNFLTYFLTYIYNEIYTVTIYTNAEPAAIPFRHTTLITTTAHAPFIDSRPADCTLLNCVWWSSIFSWCTSSVEQFTTRTLKS